MWTMTWEDVKTWVRKKIKAWLNWETTIDDDAYTQVVVWIESYRVRLNGNNRFLISPEIIRDAFPEFSVDQVLTIWYRLAKERRYVDTDPFDNAWVVK